MSAIHAITLPKWGLEMSEGTISAWHVEEGVSIEKGGDLVDIETDKIVNTLDIERAGTVRRLLAQPGDVLPVGALIAVLAPAEVKDSEVDAFISSYRPIDASFERGVADPEPASPTVAGPAPAAAAKPETAPGKPAAVDDTNPSAKAPGGRALSGDALRAANGQAHATPIARRVATQFGIDLSTVSGSGRNGRVSRDDVDRAAASLGLVEAGAAAAPRISSLSPDALKAANAGVHASPIGRKVANAHGIELGGIAATGARGRVSLADVRGTAEKAGIALPPLASRKPKDVAASPRTPEGASARPAATPSPAGGAIVAFAGMRKSIAEAMVRAKKTVPHFYTTIDVDVDALLALRESVNGRGARTSLNDYVLRASALALKAHPEVNVHVFDEGIQSFDRADIAIAVAIEAGLMTPVLRDVGARSVSEIAAAASELAERARGRALTADQLKGATFTVSNLGMFGVRQFDAIVTPPQAAILAVGGIRREAHENQGGIAFMSVMSLTLSADHRAVDGAIAARFLASVRDLLQDPLSLMM